MSKVHLYFDFFTYNSSALVGSTFGAIWKDPEGGYIKFVIKRASKQDQTLHMEGKFTLFSTSGRSEPFNKKWRTAALMMEISSQH